MTGAYYSNHTAADPFSGTPALTRVDPTVNFDWGFGSPDPAISVTNFTIRWTGDVQALFTETYEVMLQLLQASTTLRLPELDDVISSSSGKQASIGAKGEVDNGRVLTRPEQGTIAYVPELDSAIPTSGS